MVYILRVPRHRDYTVWKVATAEEALIMFEDHITVPGGSSILMPERSWSIKETPKERIQLISDVLSAYDLFWRIARFESDFGYVIDSPMAARVARAEYKRQSHTRLSLPRKAVLKEIKSIERLGWKETKTYLLSKETA